MGSGTDAAREAEAPQVAEAVVEAPQVVETAPAMAEQALMPSPVHDLHLRGDEEMEIPPIFSDDSPTARGKEVVDATAASASAQPADVARASIAALGEGVSALVRVEADVHVWGGPRLV